MKNKLQPTRTSFSRNFQCIKAPRWLSRFFHFGTENQADQLKKPPCTKRVNIKTSLYCTWPGLAWLLCLTFLQHRLLMGEQFLKEKCTFHMGWCVAKKKLKQLPRKKFTPVAAKSMAPFEAQGLGRARQIVRLPNDWLGYGIWSTRKATFMICSSLSTVPHFTKESKTCLKFSKNCPNAAISCYKSTW